ncbi:MAG: DUF853 domain-containing protein, partial [Bauldia sp.]|nr:DUF853 domain-containing protein [Bauldia sp.]
PDLVLAQMGNRVQHALRAFTPRDIKAVKIAADTFRPNPAFSTFEAITRLGVGEALVSTLEGKGVPSIVERTLMRPPSSRIGTITGEERAAVIAASPVGTIYDKPIDRESAFEMLRAKVEANPAEGVPKEAPSSGGAVVGGGIGAILGSIFGTNVPRNQRLSTTQRVAREVTRSVTNRVAGQVAADVGKSVGGSLGGTVGRAIVRSILGGILRR